MKKNSIIKPIPIIQLQKDPIKKKKSKKNNKKIAKTRRQRGYHWEDTIVKRFNAMDSWKAFRLGSPSVALPDVLVVNTKDSTIFTIEAKSGTVNSLLVPSDQITRCLHWAETFDIYNTRKVILAFKFLSKKRIGLGKYESRELREFFKVWNTKYDIANCVCNYEGEMFSYQDGKRIRIHLKDYPMPFHKISA